MPHVGLDRADRQARGGQARGGGEDPAGASHLGRITDARPGCVAFQQADAVRGHSGRRIGRPDRPGLAILGRSEQAVAPTVVGQPHAADHSEDRRIRRDRVVQPHERHERGALGGDESIGVAMKRPAPSGAAHRGQRTEAHVDEEIVGPAHPAGQHHVGPAVVEPVAGELDRVQRGRAGGVDGESAEPQLQSTGGEDGRKP